MTDNKKHIYGIVIFVVLGLLFPILFLLRLIPASVAFPIIFTILGANQLFIGIVVAKQKTAKIMSIILGSLFIIFSLVVVLPTYV